METTQAYSGSLRSLRGERAGSAGGPEPIVQIAGRGVGEGQLVFVIAEIGINHNGSLELCEKLIEGAAQAGSDAVKFQKRTPELCVPLEQWNVARDTPWGRMSYIDYKRKIELGQAELEHIDRLCKRLGMLWFASCWDLPSIEVIERFAPPCYKAASASLTDHQLLRGMKGTGKPLIISTGMSSVDEIDAAVSAVGHKHLLIAHSTSTYPCPVDELNLRMIPTLKLGYPSCPI